MPPISVVTLGQKSRSEAKKPSKVAVSEEENDRQGGNMKKSCKSCAYQTDINKCLALHIRWRDASLVMQSVKNCPDWKGKGNNKKEVE